MSGGRCLTNPLPKYSPTSNDVGDLRLVTVNLNCARSHKIRCRIQIQKLCSHLFSILFLFVLVITSRQSRRGICCLSPNSKGPISRPAPVFTGNCVLVTGY